MKKLLSVLSVFVLLLTAFTGSQAAVFTVTTSSDNFCDDGDCRLYAALSAASSNGQADTVNIEAGTHRTYFLSSALNAIYSLNGKTENYPLVIQGAGVGQTILDGSPSYNPGNNLYLPMLIDTRGMTGGDASADVTIRGITFQYGYSPGFGGGLVMASNDADLTVEDCEFIDNEGGHGAALYALVEQPGEGTITIRDNTVSTNQGTSGYGGGVSTDNDLGVTIVDGNVITDNTTNGGGAGGTFNTWDGSVRLTNNIFAGNRSENPALPSQQLFGGGITAYAYSGSLILTNNTFTGNSVQAGGGGAISARLQGSGHLYFYNNIIWGNMAGAVDDDVYINDWRGADETGTAYPGALVDVHNNYYTNLYSYMESNYPAASNVSYSANIDTTTSPDLTGNYHLQASSLGINAGTNSALYLPTSDIDGDNRTLDGVPDIGADEYTTGPTDGDSDGYYTPDDCDDGDAAINPGATEVCDGVDNDCDGGIDTGLTSTFYADTDSDTFGDAMADTQACTAPSGYVADNTDCDDGDFDIKPGATEVCDGVDNDCDESVDEGVTTTFYADTDSDTFGNAMADTQACSAPSGYVSDGTDCDDGDFDINPAATEVCDGVDNDCDDSIDELVTTTFYSDTDSDTFGNAMADTEACTVPSGYVSDDTDCDDGDAAINPDAVEICDSVDNDCDDEVDEGFDGDMDEFASCVDCDDEDPAINPGADEICDDGIDNNCDGNIDDDDALCNTGGGSSGGCNTAWPGPGEPVWPEILLIAFMTSLISWRRLSGRRSGRK